MDDTIYSDECNRESEVSFWFSKRFFISVLMFFGTINTFALSANLNIAIVEMTSTKTTTLQNETIVHVSTFIISTSHLYRPAARISSYTYITLSYSMSTSDKKTSTSIYFSEPRIRLGFANQRSHLGSFLIRYRLIHIRGLPSHEIWRFDNYRRRRSHHRHHHHVQSVHHTV